MMSINYFEYVGNLHVHSNFSDGQATIPEIIALANEAGLDFLGINDHNTLMGKDKGYEGKYQRLNLLIGAEIGRRYNHYLAYNIQSALGKKPHSAQEIINGVNNQGGFGFLAHPFDSPTWFRPYSFAWRDWNINDFNGICLWNFSTEWLEAFQKPGRNLKSQLDWIPEAIGPSAKILTFWDQRSKYKQVPGHRG